MKGTVSTQPLGAADAEKHFSELLHRVADRGETITIARNGREVAELKPASRLLTLGDLRGALAGSQSVDEGFARDLEQIRSEQPLLPADPWVS